MGQGYSDAGDPPRREDAAAAAAAVPGNYFPPPPPPLGRGVRAEPMPGGRPPAAGAAAGHGLFPPRAGPQQPHGNAIPQSLAGNAPRNALSALYASSARDSRNAYPYAAGSQRQQPPPTAKSAASKPEPTPQPASVFSSIRNLPAALTHVLRLSSGLAASDEVTNDAALAAATSSQPSMEDLPVEIVAHIFTFLSLADLASCASVCRLWRAEAQRLPVRVQIMPETRLGSWFNMAGHVLNLGALAERLQPWQLRCVSALHTAPRQVSGVAASGITELELAATTETMSRGSLAELGHLDRLVLTASQPTLGSLKITDVSALAGVRQLTLRGVYNLADVSSLAGVHELTLDDCPAVQDVSALRHVKKLALYSLPQLENVAELGSGSIAALSIFDCPLVRHIGALGSIATLMLGRLPEVTDVSGLTRVKRLAISGLDKVEDLAGITAVEHLTIVNCRAITDLYALLDMPHLTHVALRYCKITDVSPLAHVPHVSLTFCYALTDCRSLSTCTTLHVASCCNLVPECHDHLKRHVPRLIWRGNEKIRGGK